MDERTALIGLSLLRQAVPLAVKRLLEACGSGVGVWEASEQQLRSVESVPASLVAAMRPARKHLERDAAHALTDAQRQDATVITLVDAEYPARLKTIFDPPIVLYMRGALAPADEIAIAIVGSRHPTPYGIEVAEQFGRELAARGVTVVSGMARGIDSASHRGALAGDGRTIAVLGSGLARLYPPEHAELADQIAASGAVISEFPLTARASKTSFPQRNRVISGLALGVLVVEAAEKSGALITAGYAAEHGREMFAVPGKISSPLSAGTHALLKDGATLVTSVDDVLEELRLTPARVPQQKPRSTALPTLTPQENLLLGLLSDEPLYVDDLAAAAQLAPAELSSILVRLELQQLVRQWPGQRYTLHSQ